MSFLIFLQFLLPALLARELINIFVLKEVPGVFYSVLLSEWRQRAVDNTSIITPFAALQVLWFGVEKQIPKIEFIGFPK